MEIQEIRISELKFAEYNPRIITKEEFEGLKQSIKSFKLVDPIIVNKDYTIIGGHQRVRAAKELGFITVPCNVLDLDKKQEKKLNVVLNSHAISGKYDELKLDEILEELRLDEDYESLRLNELESLDLSTPEVHEDDFEPPKEAKYKVEVGDIFQLGEHRLMCGDSTNIEQVEKLMNGEKADMVFTDPPYGINFQSNFRKKTPQFEKLENDDVVLDLSPVLSVIMKTNTVAYVCTRWDLYPKWHKQLGNILDIKNCIVWYKKGGGLGDLENTYSPNHEFIIVGHNGNTKLRGKRDADVWEIGRDGFNDYKHPTQKPVALSSFAINHHSDKDDITLDLFGGSGSTLIACEQLNRKCYMMELDPYYCSVIIERWEKLTNKEHQKL